MGKKPGAPPPLHKPTAKHYVREGIRAEWHPHHRSSDAQEVRVAGGTIVGVFLVACGLIMVLAAVSVTALSLRDRVDELEAQVEMLKEALPAERDERLLQGSHE